MDAQAPEIEAKVDELVGRIGQLEQNQSACRIKWEAFDELKVDVRAIRDALAPLKTTGTTGTDGEPKRRAPIIINLGAKAGWLAVIASAIAAAAGFAT